MEAIISECGDGLVVRAIVLNAGVSKDGKHCCKIHQLPATLKPFRYHSSDPWVQTSQYLMDQGLIQRFEDSPAFENGSVETGIYWPESSGSASPGAKGRRWGGVLSSAFPPVPEGEVMSPIMRPSTRKVASQHFPIDVNVEFTVQASGSKVVGRGRTVTVSANEFSFTCAETLPPQGAITFSIAWPVKLNGAVALNLCGRGRYVRTRADRATVEFASYEFRIRPTGIRRHSRLEFFAGRGAMAGNIARRALP